MPSLPAHDEGKESAEELQKEEITRWAPATSTNAVNFQHV